MADDDRGDAMQKRMDRRDRILIVDIATDRTRIFLAVASSVRADFWWLKDIGTSADLIQPIKNCRYSLPKLYNKPMDTRSKF